MTCICCVDPPHLADWKIRPRTCFDLEAAPHVAASDTRCACRASLAWTAGCPDSAHASGLIFLAAATQDKSPERQDPGVTKICRGDLSDAIAQAADSTSVPAIVSTPHTSQGEDHDHQTGRTADPRSPEPGNFGDRGGHTFTPGFRTRRTSSGSGHTC